MLRGRRCRSFRLESLSGYARRSAGQNGGYEVRTHARTHVRVHVEVPTHLNAAQRAKLQEFAGLCDENVNPQTKSFFERARELFR